MERQAGFSLTLLRMIESSAVDPVVQQAAGTYFKNFVKRSWDRVCKPVVAVVVVVGAVTKI